MPNGTYQIVVTAKDGKEEKIDATTYTTGRVTSAELDSNGSTILNIGDTKVAVKDVVAVREIVASTDTTKKPTTATSTAATSTTTNANAV